MDILLSNKTQVERLDSHPQVLKISRITSHKCVLLFIFCLILKQVFYGDIICLFLLSCVYYVYL
jgi:hypothetical protein